MALNPPTIGVVATIKCEPRFRAYFEGAVQANQAAGYTTPVYQDGLGYALADLQNAIQYFNTGPHNVGLIVTTGGLAAFNAANAYATAHPGCVPFLSLVGAVPAPLAAKCWGGVSLESYANNIKRVAYLVNSHGFAGKNQSITLYYNSNSAMHAAELQNWQNTVVPAYQEANPTPVDAMMGGANNSSDYTTTAAELYPGGVIVSADPYFNRTRNQLIGALNTFIASSPQTNYVCYPLYDYDNNGGSNQPTGGNASLLGPRLEEAVVLLGTLAALTINSGATLGLPFLKQPLGPPKDLK
jgi:hypothetical protein